MRLQAGELLGPYVVHEPLGNGACIRARGGLKDEAISLLQRSFAKGYGKRDWIERDPDYDSLRDDPRFQAMLAKLH